ncbi:MAG TPA: hypothetical protein VLY04_13370 [Bryobacteraceae bacterium]|nr:hypothetical protein [Bryobacteraceae bacterium]
MPDLELSDLQHSPGHAVFVHGLSQEAGNKLVVFDRRRRLLLGWDATRPENQRGAAQDVRKGASIIKHMSSSVFGHTVARLAGGAYRCEAAAQAGKHLFKSKPH